MIQLVSENLLSATTAHLLTVQTEINGVAGFEPKVGKAKSKWVNKTSSLPGRSAFADIKAKLVLMCSGAEICVYCEHNEATDVEHIYPKRLYPSKSFVWGNYVLACAKCNTHFKKDKCSIFNPTGSTTAKDISPEIGAYEDPGNEDILFINQRIENPMDFLELDFVGRTFSFIEKQAEGTREYLKGEYTKNLLGLNKRADLVEHRKAAYNYFKAALEKYIAVNATTAFAALELLLDSTIDVINTHGVFADEKNKILEVIKQRIKIHNHPTVWKEMIRQRENLPTVKSLFQQAPEALAW